MASCTAAPPSITSFSPDMASTLGTTNIAITGTNFLDVDEVKIGGVSALFTVNSTTQITATAPVNPVGPATVEVITPGGAATAAATLTYVPPPTIASNTPVFGPTTGGTQVQITGANFTNAYFVSIAGVTVTSFTIDSPTQITATTAAGSAGIGDIIVITPGGTVSRPNSFTYFTPPTLTSSSPPNGPTTGGTPVVITGANLLSTSSVLIAGTPATGFTINGPTQITATTGAGSAGTGDIIVTTPGGTVSLPNSFTYVTPPTIASSSPSAGPTSGGTPVVIIGTNLLNASSVSIAGTPASSFTINSANQITATTAAGSAGLGDIIITTPGGTVSLPNSFTYVAPPTLTSVSPPNGPLGGGTSVVIAGTNLSTATSVSIGGTVAAFTVNGPTQITATTPAGNAGPADILVTTAGGSEVLAGGFTYVPAPTLTSISPQDGPTGGGTSVVIIGTDLSTTTSVSIGGAVAAFTVNGPTQITATTPAGSAGPADVVVTTAGGNDTLSGAFTYVPAPTLTSVSPANGPLGGGTVVVISGTNLSNATSVLFGGTAATGFTVISPTQITATAPASSAGAADIIVTTAGGSVTLPGAYTYVPAPTLTSVSPPDGPLGGGTSVVIIGTNLSTTTSVSIGGTGATFTVNGPTQITATTPAGSAGAADVVVTTAGGSVTLAGSFTYVPAPTLTSVSPPNGPLGGGTSVVIIGTNLSNATSVSFGGTAATFTVNGPTQITATTPAGSAGPADIVVTTAGGSETLAGGFTYVPVPTLTSVSPPNGPLGGGTSVVITGTNLSTATSVSIGGTVAAFTVTGPTQITATTPAGSAGPADIVVMTAGGSETLAGAFTYVPAPTLTSVSPQDGPASGGTSVVIIGTDLLNATSVSFGGTAATGFTVNSSTQITATTPAGGAGPADVVVTTAGGSVTLAGAFTYVPAPTLTSVSPPDGPLGGGTTVVITGADFSNATSVSFGASAATAFTINSATQITATTPAGSAGAVDVVVVTVGGSTTLPGGFTYVAPPTLTSALPADGPTSGGTSVVITGTNLSNATAVSFGGTAATAFTASATQITATTPAGGAGPVDIVVTTAGGSVTLAGGFTYVPAPTLTSVSPPDGPTSGGTSVVITGTNLSNVSAVSFGATAAASFTLDSATQITATTPAGSAGAVDVVVTSVGGSVALTGGFTYVAAPALTSVSPTAGPTGGGTVVVITGTSLSNVSTVSFGATAATSFTLDSATQITATAPAGSVGPVDIVVASAGGVATLPGGFAYVGAPTVTSITPTNGPTSGGTAVVITGTDLSTVSAVSFGSIPATSFTVNSATQVTATTPAGSAGAVDVVVTAVGGTDTLPGGFTYVVPLPAITSVSPNTGSTLGGTAVTVSGTGLTGASALAFGGVAATSFTVVSDIQITAVTPAGASGPVDVSVTTPGGSNSLPAGFTYTAAPPTLSSASPNDGSTTGGTTVTIVGTNLTGANAVAFGVTPAASYTVVSDTQITAVSPAHAAGTVDIVVTTPLGSADLPGAFTFTSPLPTVAGISPNTGDTLGGTSVVITGSNFAGASAVSFGGTAAGSFVIDSASQITAVTPAHPAGAVNVVVTTPAGSSAAGAVFTYILPVRPDPSLDPEVVGLINAQASTATRFARTQMRNFHGRLERLHNERERRAASMDVRFGFPTEKRKENAVERLLDQQTSNAQRLSKGEKSSAASSYGYGTDGVGPISGAVSQGQSSGGGEAQPENSRLAFWSGGFVNFGDRENSGVDIDHTNIGVSGGFDYRFSDRFVAGLGIGFSRDRTDVGNNGTESEAHAFSAAVYGSFEPVDNFFIDGLFGGGTLNFDSRRFVTSTGDFAIGERDGSQVFGSLTAAYELREESWLVSPYARVEFSRSWLDEFTETGGGIYNLTYGKQTVDSFSGILGVRANKAFEMDWGILRPGIRAEYVHDFDGSSRARLGYADLGGLPYEVELQDKERDYLTLGLSMELQFENNWDLIFDYRAMLDGEGDAEQTVGVQLNVRF
ncbi:uncharacterized protein YhjY with autotransporter beta-barrel domain [Neorhizobium huautlense]|uniref:Uncharacterized protein YhjY with autotransporter beta-barrel domain n=1 Tax=Neorhizobium huautlense TaxID=67774 RepID=A0ABT9PLD6_9HYPH|nr:IPT/TIG domain-containing protein [Neorhizobium huautlense]MDP9835267.1 uncharacterized protein YhjY with autotransporter beta-barrel domain [Neorhizobium huautlense]